MSDHLEPCTSVSAVGRKARNESDMVSAKLGGDSKTMSVTAQMLSAGTFKRGEHHSWERSSICSVILYESMRDLCIDHGVGRGCIHATARLRFLILG